MQSATEEAPPNNLVFYIPMTHDGCIPKKQLAFLSRDLERQKTDPTFTAQSFEINNREGYVIADPQQPGAKPQAIQREIKFYKDLKTLLLGYHSARERAAWAEAPPMSEAEGEEFSTPHCAAAASAVWDTLDTGTQLVIDRAMWSTGLVSGFVGESSFGRNPHLGYPAETERLLRTHRRVHRLETLRPDFVGELANVPVPNHIFEVVQAVVTLPRPMKNMPSRKDLRTNEVTREHFNCQGTLKWNSELHLWRRDLSLFSEAQWLFLTRTDWEKHLADDFLKKKKKE